MMERWFFTMERKAATWSCTPTRDRNSHDSSHSLEERSGAYGMIARTWPQRRRAIRRAGGAALTQTLPRRAHPSDFDMLSEMICVEVRAA